MREDICSIPVSEVFEQKDGCPFCRIYRTLEDHLLEYILGPAMMEPDVRIETNRLGFCGRHADLLLKSKNRLALALVMQSRLQTASQKLFPKPPLGLLGPKVGRAEELTAHCFLCEKIDHSMSMLMNTFFQLWKTEREFRALTESQPIYCLPHYAMLLERGRTALDKRAYGDFAAAIGGAAGAGLAALRADIDHFCEMFDYRNAGGDWGTSRDAVERAVRFLTGDLRY